MNIDNKLDFCRVKKINENGFGFLQSLIYNGDIFFHFSQIKKEEFKDKLNKMKRGEFFLYYLSKPTEDNKRKVAKLWYTLNDVPNELSINFIDSMIAGFYNDKFNLFDLLHAFKEYKEKHTIYNEHLIKIFNSQKIQHNPTTILKYLNQNEYNLLKECLNLSSFTGEKPYWYDELINYNPE